MAEEDMIFGKNRHFFGGIEPSNMLKFNATVDNAARTVLIEAELPKDTVVDGQTLCTVAGAVIRRRSDTYPVDEFDGEAIATITADTTVTDKEIVPYGSYFYSAFPFTKQGVYNRNPANRTSINEPADLISFNVEPIYNSETDSIAVRIMAELPPKVTGAIVCRSTEGYPVNENDGERVTTFTTSGGYIDTTVEMKNTYYYAAFPYKTENENTFYNRSENNRDVVVVSAYKYYYGYDMVLGNIPSTSGVDEAEPDKRVVYPKGVMNENYTPLTFDTSTHQPKWGNGSWNEDEPFMPKPCLIFVHGVNGTWVVDRYYLDPYDYNKFDDGSSLSSKFNYGALPNGVYFMMEWSKIYTKRWEDKDSEGNTWYHFRCSDVKIDNEYECWCNYDKNNKEIDNFYTAIYLSDADGNSKPDRTPCKGITYESAKPEERDANLGFDVESLADRLLIQDLLVMMAKNTDCESVYGYASSSFLNSSTTGGLFNKTGATSFNTATKSNRVFGMEHYWGCRARIIPNWTWSPQYPGKYNIKVTPGNIDSQILKDYETDGNGYLIVDGPTRDCGGYISEMKTYPFGRLPTKANGSSSRYEADFLKTAEAGAGYRPASAAFFYGEGLYSGPFAVDFTYGPNELNPYSGFAICYKPIKTE